jgi:hypothetical protein
MLVIDNRQTLLDIAIQELGDAERLVELALLNGFDIDDIDATTEIVVSTVDASKKKIIDGLATKKIKPASFLASDKATVYEDEWTLYYTVGLPPTHG